MTPAASAPAKSSRSSIQNSSDTGGRDRDGEARYEQACNRARSLGLNYVPAADAAVNLTLDDILRRFEILTRRGTADSASEVSAVLGGAPAPVIMIDGMVDEFEEIIRASLTSKSPRQRKKWRQPKETALSAFVDLVGNRPITSLTRQTRFDCGRTGRTGWWLERADWHCQQVHRSRQHDVPRHQ